MPNHFRPIAQLLARTLHPPPHVEFSTQGILDCVQHQGTLITVNHFTAPDFHAWWFVILISAILPAKIRWVVTSGWTNSGWLDGFTHWLFPLGARVLGFTSMPAMPLDPNEAELRAAAVREVVGYTRSVSKPVVGLAPEGGDSPAGALSTPPSGVGRFVNLLSRYCPQIVPVGVWKSGGVIQLKFGEPYTLDVPPGLSPDALDQHVRASVMQHIAALLPEHLRGVYK